MTPSILSPQITHVSWGRMEVEGVGTGKDFKLYPGGGREWDWRETGTQHVPGIQPADVQELLDHGLGRRTTAFDLIQRLHGEETRCTPLQGRMRFWLRHGIRTFDYRGKR